MVNINQNLGYPGCIFINLKFGVNLTISFLQCRAGSKADMVNILTLLHWKGLFLTSPIYCKWSHYFYTVRGGKRKETCSSDSLIVLMDKKNNSFFLSDKLSTRLVCDTILHRSNKLSCIYNLNNIVCLRQNSKKKKSVWRTQI